MFYKSLLSVEELNKIDGQIKVSISKQLTGDLRVFLENCYNQNLCDVQELADLNYDSPLMLDISDSNSAQKIISNMFLLAMEDAKSMGDRESYLKLASAESLYREKLAYLNRQRVILNLHIRSTNPSGDEKDFFSSNNQ